MFKDWNIEELTGYKPISTFYLDFSIAEYCGAKAVNDTYFRAFRDWKDSVEMVTELCMVLNWKTWQHQNDKWCDLYCQLYYRLDEWIINNLKGEDLAYYYRTTD